MRLEGHDVGVKTVLLEEQVRNAVRQLSIESATIGRELESVKPYTSGDGWRSKTMSAVLDWHLLSYSSSKVIQSGLQRNLSSCFTSTASV